MSEQEKRKSYALAFASFLVRRMGSIPPIKRIILYGSVAKGSSTKDSDVDIFIDVEKDTLKTRNAVNSAVMDFYKSKEAIMFKLLGIDAEIKAKTGRLDDWEDLKRSILSEGILLWGKLEGSKPNSTKHMVIFFWNKTGKNRGAFLNRVYGFKSGDRRYPGLITKGRGKKLGKSCVMLPISYREEMVCILKKYGVEAQAVEAFV